MLQCRTVQELHYDEGFLTVLADLVDRADIRMVQGRCCTSFPTKTFECLRISGYVFRQEFQCYEATEFDVLGLVDHPHSAAAQFFQNAVVRDGLANGLEGRGHEWMLAVHETQSNHAYRAMLNVTRGEAVETRRM